MEEFGACSSGGERALLAYHCIPEESTTIDRCFPVPIYRRILQAVADRTDE